MLKVINILILITIFAGCGEKTDEFLNDNSAIERNIIMEAITPDESEIVRIPVKNRVEVEKKKNEVSRKVKISRRKTAKKIKNAVEKDEDKYIGPKERAEMYYKKALGFLKKNNDSALYYADLAINLYENGSIFRVKAEAHYYMNMFPQAIVASDVCLERNDHWDVKDIIKSKSIRCASLMQLYNKYPSRESERKYEECLNTFDGSSF